MKKTDRKIKKYMQKWNECHTIYEFSVQKGLTGLTLE